jgi:transposase-like protein
VNASKDLSQPALFRRRRFGDEVIILCLRWYLRFKLSYRDMAEIAWELGVLVAPSTILRWVVRYAEDFSRLWRRFEKPVGGSWRCDETYIKVHGQWMYLYRAVDKLGRTVESHLSRTRDIAAAKAFFRKALKHHGQPRTITLDGFEASHSALRRMGMRNEFNYRCENPVKIHSCQVPEQYCGAGPPAREISRATDARLQDFLQCSTGFDRY